ncbi:unnamed protein product [Diamesa serratosioi]
MKPVPVIIDCDSGNDDAWAIISLLKAEKKFNLKLLAITCCNGNTTVDHSTLNNLLILETVNRMDVPVYAGAESSLIKKTEYYKPFHGADGFGEIYKTKPDKELLQKKHAVEALKDYIEENPEELVLIAVGPLTNVALLYKLYPGISAKIKELHIMGGNYKGEGNITPSAEFNFWMDPEAANIVLAESLCPVIIFPWESCKQASIGMPFDDWRINILSSNRNNICNLMDPIESKVHAFDNFVPCDAFSTACFMIPKLITKQVQEHVTVELSGNHTRGQMIIDHTKSKKPNAIIIHEINVESFKTLLMWICGHEVANITF